MLQASETAPSLQDVVNRMDQAAAKFRSMSAKIERTKHTSVLNSDDTESGTVYMKKTVARVEGLMNIIKPDKKTSAFAGREVQIYYPNMKEVDIYDAGKNGEQLEQFLTLGFGTAGTDLEKTYKMRVLGTEVVKGEKTAHLELIPKSGEAKKLVKQIDLWIGERNYPVQEKIFEPSGDYDLWSYSDVQINGDLKDQDVQLKLPAGVKKVYPQKP
jgi:outer membrane lipoprotein-sorting protein